MYIFGIAILMNFNEYSLTYSMVHESILIERFYAYLIRKYNLKYRQVISIYLHFRSNPLMNL